MARKTKPFKCSGCGVLLACRPCVACQARREKVLRPELFDPGDIELDPDLVAAATVERQTWTEAEEMKRRRIDKRAQPLRAQVVTNGRFSEAEYTDDWRNVMAEEKQLPEKRCENCRWWTDAAVDDPDWRLCVWHNGCKGSGIAKVNVGKALMRTHSEFGCVSHEMREVERADD